jgi:hypothetical protein
MNLCWKNNTNFMFKIAVLYMGKFLYNVTHSIHYYNNYYYFNVIGCSPGGSRPYTDTDKEIRLYTKGTIQNKVHTMQIQTYAVPRSTHVTRIHNNPNAFEYPQYLQYY